MNLKRVLRKNVFTIVVVAVVGVILYNYLSNEGFQTAMCSQSRCTGGNKTWINGVCYGQCINNTFPLRTNPVRCVSKLRPNETTPSVNIRRPIITNC